MTHRMKPPEHLAAMQLSDGGTLAWAEWGPIGGLPVVSYTGAAMSCWLGFGDDVGDLGVRLLALALKRDPAGRGISYGNDISC